MENRLLCFISTCVQIYALTSGSNRIFSLMLTKKKLIGERSEPPSDKLGGEICIVSRALICLSLYIYIYGVRTA